MSKTQTKKYLEDSFLDAGFVFAKIRWDECEEWSQINITIMIYNVRCGVVSVVLKYTALLKYSI